MPKKKKSKRIPRDEYIGGIIDTRKTGEIRVSMDSNGDNVVFHNMEENSGFHTISYKGKNKERVLSHIQGSNSLSFSQEELIFKNYERVYFIDTNDSLFHGKKSGCTAVFELHGHKQALLSPTGRGKVLIKFLVGYYLFEVSDDVAAEKIGWHLFLESTKNFIAKFGENKKALLITDHALGDHRKINNRSMAYYKDYYLPKNIELGYAKADKGESFAEKGLKQADKMANVIKESFKSQENKRLLIKVPKDEPNYHGFIQILPENIG